jgi:hypothetical protein
MIKVERAKFLSSNAIVLVLSLAYTILGKIIITYDNDDKIINDAAILGNLCINIPVPWKFQVFEGLSLGDPK